jgi:penicillin-binding protein 2
VSDTRVRTSIIAVVVFALFSALFARLWYLQVAAADQFHAAAAKNAVREIREPAIRGRILDAAGNVLVDNRVENDITVDRKISDTDKKKVLAKLSTLLGTPVAKLEVNLNDPRISPYTAVPVATDVAYDKLAWVAEH